MNKKQNVFWNGSVQDEYYTPRYAVDIIIPFLKNKGFRKVLCPFDSEKSNYVKVLRENGFIVDASILPKSFFDYSIDELCEYDVIVSNPPFSKKMKFLKDYLKVKYHLCYY